MSEIKLTNQEYEFKRVSADQLTVIQSLFERSFDAKVPLSFLQKKYDTSVFGKRDIGYVAYHEASGDPAAYYGVFPVTFNVNGNTVLACQSGDTMTAPEHRKKGLFVQLAEKTYELAAEEGIQFVFGFPNSFSYRGFEKLGWSFFGNMQDFVISSGGAPLSKISKKAKVLDGFYQRYAESVLSNLALKEGEGAFSNPPSEEVYQVDRSGNFIRYKQYGKATIVELDGFKIWLKAEGVLRIGNVEYFEPGAEQRLMGAIKKLAFKLGCGKVQFSLSPNHWLNKRLAQSHTASEGLAIGFLNFSKDIDYQFEKISFSLVDFDTF